MGDSNRENSMRPAGIPTPGVPTQITASHISPNAPKPRLLDQVRQAIRTRQYSYKTEKAYVGWIKRFIFFHGKRHPAEMGEAEIARFLSSLATERSVSASTPNQALNATLALQASPA
jgi:hypothetical protein